MPRTAQLHPAAVPADHADRFDFDALLIEVVEVEDCRCLGSDELLDLWGTGSVYGFQTGERTDCPQQ